MSSVPRLSPGQPVQSASLQPKHLEPLSALLPVSMYLISPKIGTACRATAVPATCHAHASGPQLELRLWLGTPCAARQLLAAAQCPLAARCPSL